MVKFFLKKERLNFMKGWAASQWDMEHEVVHDRGSNEQLTATASTNDTLLRAIAEEECDNIEDTAIIYNKCAAQCAPLISTLYNSQAMSCETLFSLRLTILPQLLSPAVPGLGGRELVIADHADVVLVHILILGTSEGPRLSILDLFLFVAGIVLYKHDPHAFKTCALALLAGWCEDRQYPWSISVPYRVDESNLPFPDNDEDDKDDLPIPVPVTLPIPAPVYLSIPAPVSGSIPAPVPPLIPVPVYGATPHSSIIRRSGRLPVPTEKGLAFRNRLAQDKSRLTCQRDIHTTQINGIPPPPGSCTTPAPIVITPTQMSNPP
ncbi:uncharacterized protein EDB91DRAFT_1088938 [Suillus paluster]|uniref:uncharacterized protein n=1 Tax=Suillus paluster TaxID=48578 RepID=UPI001B886247|nr:uncharacterized protein EDB91DRAFT_1088938 [Suillus paluster]KAG1720168.1 hypothetical protein EDB91DRAFT_1088938 [Suillus paluster]